MPPVESEQIAPPEWKSRESIILDFVTQYMQVNLRHGRVPRRSYIKSLFESLERTWGYGLRAGAVEDAQLHVRHSYPVLRFPSLEEWEIRLLSPRGLAETVYNRRKEAFPFIEDPEDSAHVG